VYCFYDAMGIFCWILPLELLAPLRKSKEFPKESVKGWNAEARRRWDS